MKYYFLKSEVEMENCSEESYGVMFLNDDGSREYICNISDDSDKIRNLVDEMNSHHVESYHAKEIIEDLPLITLN